MYTKLTIEINVVFVQRKLSCMMKKKKKRNRTRSETIGIQNSMPGEGNFRTVMARAMSNDGLEEEELPT